MVYEGLAIGGPMAGQWISRDEPTFVIIAGGGGMIEHEDGSFLLWDGNPEFHDYIHLRALPDVEFWVPKGKDFAWAIAELARSYRSVFSIGH